MGKYLLYLFYGLVSGFSQFTTVSASAHQALFPLLLKFDSTQPLLKLFVHGGALGAVALLYWKRIGHLYREVRLDAAPARGRKRPADSEAVLDGRLLLTAAIPTLLGAFFSWLAEKMEVRLLPLALVLILGGVLAYLPDYLPGGDRRTKLISPLEGVLMGLLIGVSVIPGLSAMGLLLGIFQLRKCQKAYLLEMGVLLVGFLLAGMMAVDLVQILIRGFSGFSGGHLLGCLLAGAAAFGGGVGAILTMRFLSVKSSFSGFVYYCWGLGLFSFILYLTV